MGSFEHQLGKELRGLNISPTYEEMLWDSFATEALGALANKDLKAVIETLDQQGVEADVCKWAALLSYEFADAMMGERKRRKEE